MSRIWECGENEPTVIPVEKSGDITSSLAQSWICITSAMRQARRATVCPDCWLHTSWGISGDFTRGEPFVVRMKGCAHKSREWLKPDASFLFDVLDTIQHDHHGVQLLQTSARRLLCRVVPIHSPFHRSARACEVNIDPPVIASCLWLSSIVCYIAGPLLYRPIDSEPALGISSL